MVLLGAIALGAAVAAPAHAAGRRRFREQVYLELPAALERVLPDAVRFERGRLALSDSVRERVRRHTGRRCHDRVVLLYRGLDRAGRTLGYALVLEEIGKYRPITFAVGLTPEAEVIDVAVMVYRESHGAGVRRRRFLAQFVGKGLEDRIDPNRDIINISGATLSVRAIARGVKRAVAIVGFTIAEGQQPPRWQPWSPDSAAGGQQGRAEPAAKPWREARWRMGSLLVVTAFGARPQVTRAADAAFAEVARLEALLSSWRADSELSRLNRRAAREPVRVSEDTWRCVLAAIETARATGGAFDPTLRRGGWRAVLLDPAARTVRFERDGLALDLGGVAKGYALDRAAETLERHGVRRALLDFGGQLLALDPPPGLRGWPVWVRGPEDRDELGAALALRRASVAVSGCWERGPHVLDPRSGAPIAASAAAAVCAGSATLADGWSTALAVLGGPGGVRLPAGAAALCWSRAGQPPARSGAPGTFHLLVEATP